MAKGKPKKPKKWVQAANIKKGTFTAWCKKQGYGGVTSGCISAGLKSNDTATKRRAVLARTFKGMRGKKKKG
jgi:hypothetical protein